MPLQYTPVTQTKSGRIVKHNFSQLSEKLHYSRQELEMCFNTDMSDMLKIDLMFLKTNLKCSWSKYCSSMDNVLEYLTAQNAYDEINSHKDSFDKAKRRAKMFSQELRWKLFGLGNEDYSDIDKLSDITSASKMSELRLNRVAEMTRKAVLQREDLREATSEILPKSTTISADENVTTVRKSLEATSNLLNPNDQEPLDSTKQFESAFKAFTPNSQANDNLNLKDSLRRLKEKRTVDWLFEEDSLPDVGMSQDSNDSIMVINSMPMISTNPTLFDSVDFKPPLVKVSQPSVRPKYTYSSFPTQETIQPNTVYLKPIYSTIPAPLYTTAGRYQMHQQPHNENETPKLDSASRYLLLMELKRAPVSPFSGDPQFFFTWWSSLKNKMKPLNPSPCDQIEIIEAHTVGGPNELVKLYKNVHSQDFNQALELITRKLKQRFGNVADIANSLRQKLTSFSEIRADESSAIAAKKLRQFSDVCMLVQAHMSNIQELGTLNFASGLEDVRRKLPEHLNCKWRVHKTKYMDSYGIHPPFSEFCSWLDDQAHILCSDLPYMSEKSVTKPIKAKNQSANVFKVESSEEPTIKYFKCSLHRSDTHELKNCVAFKHLDSKTKKLIVHSHQLCFKCLGNHFSKSCNKSVECRICKSSNHITEFHIDKNPSYRPFKPLPPNVIRKNPTVLKTQFKGFGKSCSKTILADVYAPQYSNEVVRVYAIIDEQSNRSFASPALLNKLKVNSPTHDFKLTTLTDSMKRKGRVATNLSIKGVKENNTFVLPYVIENEIPDTKYEVAYPGLVKQQPHLSHLASNFCEIDPNAEVSLLIGRDAPELMATNMENTIAPYAHKTPLGWAIVGEMCPEQIESTSRTDCTTLRTQCVNDHFMTVLGFPKIQAGIFEKYADDEEVSHSIDDKRFISIIENNTSLTKNGNLQFPLPFRKPFVKFPDNHNAVYRRQKCSLDKIKNNVNKLNGSRNFMSNLINNEHVERVPKNELKKPTGSTWFLPLFPVEHPKKRKIRLVFDSAATFQGTSLNGNLLSGPDQNNKLYGVLLRFRENPVAFVADIESMFHCFYVMPEHRDYMRFYWFENNDPTEDLVQYRALCHIFGNTSSPSIAITGLRIAASSLLENNDPNSFLAYRYLTENIYMDDGVSSADTAQQAIDIINKSKEALSVYNIRLHKVLSNDPKVLSAFPSSDIDDDVFDLKNFTQTHRTLGIAWNFKLDVFSMQPNIPDRPFTRRGLLSVVNSIFDPMGFASPVVLEGKLLQREIIPSKTCKEDSSYGWDDELPDKFENRWRKWQGSLSQLQEIRVPRCYTPENFGDVIFRTLHVFADASKDAIGYVAYLHSINSRDDVHVSFVMGDSKVAPKSASSIPRLELCAAVGAVHAAAFIKREINLSFDDSYYYSDSEVTLAYIRNEQKRFIKYVSRRVEIIRTHSDSSKWNYVSSSNNPADISTRPQSASSLMKSTWLTGPSKLREASQNDLPIKEEMKTLLADLPESIEDNLGNALFTKEETEIDSIAEMLFRVNNWMKAVRVMEKVVQFLIKTGSPNLKDINFMYLRTKTIEYLMKNVQKNHYGDEITILQSKKDLKLSHKLNNLCPFIDEHGILRVGGRLKQSDLTMGKKHPILIPVHAKTTELIIDHYHEKCGHQGNHITLGAIRNAGYFIEKGKATIKKFINRCVICNKLRRTPEVQLMADLPSDRVTPTAPFVSTGMDVMGPFIVYDGVNTRRTSGGKKTWVVVFTCLSSRAVHIEMLPSLDTTAMQNAISRFTSVRGPCSLIRSDRGTNFIAANKESSLKQLRDSLDSSGCKWIFNPPHASHFGGVWERKIGQIRRALDFSLMQMKGKILSRDELHTLLAQAASIVNSTPLYEASSDPNDPLPISPQQILTLRGDQDEVVGEYNEEDMLEYGSKRWRRVEFLIEQFWNKWRTFYIQELQKRRKWTKKRRPLEEGDLVLVVDKNAPRKHWQVGIIECAMKSSDGVVRKVKIKMCKFGNYSGAPILERPISSVVLLMSVENLNKH